MRLVDYISCDKALKFIVVCYIYLSNQEPHHTNQSSAGCPSQFIHLHMFAWKKSNASERFDVRCQSGILCILLLFQESDITHHLAHHVEWCCYSFLLETKVCNHQCANDTILTMSF